MSPAPQANSFPLSHQGSPRLKRSEAYTPLAWYVHAQLRPALCDPLDYSLPGSHVHGISQARILGWVAMPSSSRSSWPRDQTHKSCMSCITGRFFTAERPGKHLAWCLAPSHHFVVGCCCRQMSYLMQGGSNTCRRPREEVGCSVKPSVKPTCYSNVIAEARCPELPRCWMGKKNPRQELLVHEWLHLLGGLTPKQGIRNGDVMLPGRSKGSWAPCWGSPTQGLIYGKEGGWVCESRSLLRTLSWTEILKSSKRGWWRHGWEIETEAKPVTSKKAVRSPRTADVCGQDLNLTPMSGKMMFH